MHSQDLHFLQGVCVHSQRFTLVRECGYRYMMVTNRSNSRSPSRSKSRSRSASRSRSRSYSRSPTRSDSRSRSRSPRHRSNHRSRSPRSRHSSSPTTCFFVGNLPFTFTDATMYDLFSKYGALKKISFPYDR